MMPPGLVLMLWLLPGLLAGPSTTLTPEQQLVLLEAANSAFEQALASRDAQQEQQYYQQAIAAYEQLIAAGVHNARLHYNLGNAYCRRNDLGRAIGQYRRGLRLEPNNPRLHANLRYARSLRQDHGDSRSPQTVQAFLLQLFFWHDALRLHTQALYAVIGFVIAWSCAIASLFWRRPVLHWLLAGAIVVCVLFSGSALTVHVQHTAVRHGVIVAEEAPVRTGNGDSYALQLLQPLRPGTEFVVLEERGAWVHVQLENNTNGWIRQEYVMLW
jgi:tetratricopeptide (TPR) repeat protein